MALRDLSLVSRKLLINLRQVSHLNEIQAIAMDYVKYEESHTNRKENPVIIMHGLMGVKENWRAFASRLAQETYRLVYSVDARNHGHSPHTADFGPQHMAADVVKFVKDQGHRQLIAMGFCMGACAMMTTALEYPKIVDRLILVDTTPIMPPTVLPLNVLDLLINLVNQMPPELSLEQAKSRAFAPIAQVMARNSHVHFILRNLKRKSSGKFYWLTNLESLRNTWARMPAQKVELEGRKPYAGPTLLIRGTQSDYVKETHLNLMRQYFINLHIEQLNATHLLHLEKPEEFFQFVKLFI